MDHARVLAEELDRIVGEVLDVADAAASGFVRNVVLAERLRAIVACSVERTAVELVRATERQNKAAADAERG